MYNFDNQIYNQILNTFKIYNDKIIDNVLMFAPIPLLAETIKFDLSTNVIRSTLLLTEAQVELFNDLRSSVEVTNFDPKPREKELQFCAIDFSFKVSSLDEVKKFLSLYNFELK